VSTSEGPTVSAERIAELIVAARDGSEAAMGQLMQFSREYLLLIANDEFPRDLQAKGGASDLVQETHMEAAREFAAFRGHTAAELFGWLRMILLNNVRDFTRHHGAVAKRQAAREVSLYSDDSAFDIARNLIAEISSPSGHLQHAEQIRKVEDAIEKLPDDYRQVVVWHHRDGLSFEEISERLDRSGGCGA
jgi:RNA polymerase sigma-70 factor (ECF subfamily)